LGFFDKFKKDEEKPKADFSNVQSGSSSTAAEPAPSLPPLEPTAGTTGQSQTYVVVAGDSLSKIAKRFYGDANKWPLIHQANSQIKNPDLIHPGQKLTIPGA
jgi:nucleoid-associated protein YgaU